MENSHPSLVNWYQQTRFPVFRYASFLHNAVTQFCYHSTPVSPVACSISVTAADKPGALCFFIFFKALITFVNSAISVCQANREDSHRHNPGSPQFYAGYPSCSNPPNLSRLGTGTEFCWFLPSEFLYPLWLGSVENRQLSINGRSFVYQPDVD